MKWFERLALNVTGSGDNKKLFNMPIVETPCHPVRLGGAGSDVHSFSKLESRTSFSGGAGKGGFSMRALRDFPGGVPN